MRHGRVFLALLLLVALTEADPSSWDEFVRGVPAETFLGWAAVLGVFSCVAAAIGLWALQRLRHSADVPTSRIRSAAQGYVELAGLARLLPGPPIIAPLTAAPCVWWRYRIEQWQNDSDGRSRWTLVEQGVSEELFALEDGTGLCVVDPDHAEVRPHRRWVWYGRSPRPRNAPRHADHFWAAIGARYRYTEELLYAGDPVYALGWFRTQGNVAAPEEEGAALRQLLLEWKQDRRRMALLDVNRDGEVDGREWEAARRAALLSVRRQNLERASDPALHVLSRPPDRRPFLLAYGTEREVLRRHRRRSLGALALSGAGAAALVWMVLVRAV